MSLHLAQLADTVMAAQPAADTGPPVPPANPALLAELQAAQRGDATAFTRLVRAYQARVFGVAMRLTGRREDAEELAQDAFVQLHAALAQIHSVPHLLHWLLRAVTHRSIDRLRSRERAPRLVEIQAGSEPAAEDAAVDPLWSKRLHSLLLRLAPAPRAVLLLRFQEDLDPAEIAAVMGLSVNTVKSHLRRSLEWLRAQQLDAGNGVDHGH